MTFKSFVAGKVSFDENSEATSQKKLEANRRNAQFSTGPKTAEGKKSSSCNAVKHGLLVKNVVINTGGNKEDQAEFDTLLTQMQNAFTPVGIAEDLLVQEMATSYWKTARALRCERGDVTCAGAESKQSELSEMDISLLMWRPAADAYYSLLRSSGGIKFLLHKIEQMRDEVEASGCLSSELCRWLAPTKNWERFSDSDEKYFLAALEKETDELTAKKSEVERDESQRRNDHCDYWAIPSKEALDRISRYETTNVRHRYKVEARLEQLQARRRENAQVNSGKGTNAESAQDTELCETKPTGSDDGLCKVPHSVALAGQTSDNLPTPQIQTDVTGGTFFGAGMCETKPTGSDDGLCKVPHSVGLAGQTSNDIATPKI